MYYKLPEILGSLYIRDVTVPESFIKMLRENAPLQQAPCSKNSTRKFIAGKGSTTKETSTLSCLCFLAEFLEQHFHQGFRNRWPFVIWTNMLGVIDPQSYHIVYCALCKVDKGYTNSSSSVTLRVSNSYHVYSNDKRSMVPESLIKMVRENAFLPKKSRQETCAGKGWSVLQSGNFFC